MSNIGYSDPLMVCNKFIYLMYPDNAFDQPRLYPTGDLNWRRVYFYNVGQILKYRS